MKRIITLLLILISLSGFSQSMKGVTPKRCGTTEKWLEMVANDPSLIAKKEAEEIKIQKWIAEHKNEKAPLLLTIPVVVQIFGSAANNAVTDNRVAEQIARLNDDFRRLNSDANNTPADFLADAVDSEIEFCLASTDPDGNATTGIVRYTGVSSPTNTYLWSAGSYLNLFVYSIGGGTLGYTYTPSTSPNEAVHIGYQYFGSTGASAPYNMGRTATHEVGHWLNLEHIWGDANCGNDLISDTPPQQTANSGCPSHPYNLGVCNGNTEGEMFMNYMDYTDDDCMNMFTLKQKERMHAAINAYRSGLFTSDGCAGSGVLSANFSGTPTAVQIGNSVAFTDQSLGGPTTWNWVFEGGTPSTSTAQDPNIAYNSTGVFGVTLTVGDGTTTDTEIKASYITVSLTPTYCTPTTTDGTADGDFINGVVLGDISNTGTGGVSGEDYYDYTSMSTVLDTSATYDLAITRGNYNGDKFAAWIDYNKDGDFTDIDEKLGEISIGTSPSTKNITFTVPNTATQGKTRLRVRCLYNNGQSGLSPCDEGDFGETEDYSVVIVDELNSLREHSKRAVYGMYPNPANNVLNFNFIKSVENVSVSIYDISGRKIKLFGNIRGTSCSLNIAELSSGNYIVKVESLDFSFTEKLTKN